MGSPHLKLSIEGQLRARLSHGIRGLMSSRKTKSRHKPATDYTDFYSANPCNLRLKNAFQKRALPITMAQRYRHVGRISNSGVGPDWHRHCGVGVAVGA